MTVYELDLDNIKGYYLIYTKDYSSVLELKNKLKNSMTYKDMNFHEVSKISYDVMKAMATAFPWLDDRKVIFAKVSESSEKEIKKIIDLNTDNAVFLVYYAEKDEKPQTNKLMKQLKNNEKITIVENIHSEGAVRKLLSGKFDEKMIGTLIKKCGLDLDLVNTEAVKLKYGASEDEIIVSEENNIFELFNLINSKDINCLEMLERLKREYTPEKMASKLLYQIRNLISVKMYRAKRIPDAETAKLLKLKSTQVSAIGRYTGNFTTSALSNAYTRLAELDEKIKNGTFSEQELDLTIMSLIQ